MNRVLNQDTAQWALLKEVHRLRVHTAELKDLEADQEHIIQDNPDYQAWQQTRETRLVRQKELEVKEKQLREISAKLAADGVEDIPGVLIMRGTSYKYDDKDAVRWCFERGFLNLVNLDSKRFEKMIPGAGETMGFLTIENTIKANIKSDLNDDIVYYGGLG